MSLRDSILQASDIKTKVVKIPGGKVEVRGLTGEQRDQLYADSRVGETIDSGLLQYNTIILSVYDPKTGERVFGAEDVAVLKAKSAELTTVLYNEISTLSGTDATALEDAEKN
jgi:hypothetical protein